jgi:signal peptidase I
MEPTYKNGDVVYVNKLLMGARIYNEFNFSKPELKCFRMPGFRTIQVGDIAVYNYQDWDNGKIGFSKYYVYCKRCIGIPKDTVSIVDGFYLNSRTGSVGMPVQKQQELSEIDENSMNNNRVVHLLYYFSLPQNWSIKNFGPLYIPAKGDTITLSEMNVALYGKEIEYEIGEKPMIVDGLVTLRGVPSEEYVFKNNWYFFGGDNVLNSKDSRYIGLVPEDFIIGIVCTNAN